jgi:hypothetical protein
MQLRNSFASISLATACRSRCGAKAFNANDLNGAIFLFTFFTLTIAVAERHKVLKKLPGIQSIHKAVRL